MQCRLDPSIRTLAELLQHRAATQRDDVAYVFHSYPADTKEEMCYGDLLAAAAGIARQLQERGLCKKPVVLLYPPGLDFIRGFFGCILAGAAPVPLSPPEANVGSERFLSVMRDVGPEAILSLSHYEADIGAVLETSGYPEPVSILCSDRVGVTDAIGWENAVPILPSDVALIQYTSGSTSQPKGVVVSHENILNNERTIQSAFGHDKSSLVVGWLPLFHDMGLIGNVLQPLYVGIPSVLMAPLSFIQRPVRWLQLISNYRATTAGGPNYGYDFCAKKIKEEDKKRLDLSHWSVAYCGSEQINPAVVDRFANAFGSCRFQRTAFYPCYGLAEATLFVTGADKGAGPRRVDVDAHALTSHNEARALGTSGASSAEARTTTLVSCGKVHDDLVLKIVDSASGAVKNDGEVGEVWLSGSTIASGYWSSRSERLRQDAFRKKAIQDGDELSHEFLATGDLGFVKDGELYITGRRKDLIIVRGLNYYPGDIEEAAAAAHSSLQRGIGAAFSVRDEEEERLVVVREVSTLVAGKVGVERLKQLIRGAIARRFQVQSEIHLVRATSIPRTSSGKIQRAKCRQLLLSGALQARTL